MDIDLIQRKFARMGARALVVPLVGSRRSPPASDVAVDIRRDDKGEYFDIRFDPRWVVDVDALDVQPAQRHLADQGRHALCRRFRIRIGFAQP